MQRQPPWSSPQRGPLAVFQACSSQIPCRYLEGRKEGRNERTYISIPYSLDISIPYNPPRGYVSRGSLRKATPLPQQRITIVSSGLARTDRYLGTYLYITCCTNARVHALLQSEPLLDHVSVFAVGQTLPVPSPRLSRRFPAYMVTTEVNSRQSSSLSSALRYERVQNAVLTADSVASALCLSPPALPCSLPPRTLRLSDSRCASTPQATPYISRRTGRPGVSIHPVYRPGPYAPRTLQAPPHARVAPRSFERWLDRNPGRWDPHLFRRGLCQPFARIEAGNQRKESQQRCRKK